MSIYGHFLSKGTIKSDIYKNSAAVFDNAHVLIFGCPHGGM